MSLPIQLHHDKDTISALELVTNRGLAYGDGLFESMIVDNGIINHWALHLARLTAGMKVLGYTASATFGDEIALELQSFIQQYTKHNELSRIKLTLWRATGGLYTPTSKAVEWSIQLQDYTPAPRVKDRVYILKDISLHHSPLSSLKTLNSLPYVYAAMLRASQGWDDAILLDSKGYISECTASNIFWIQGDTIYTPALTCGCIAGVMRAVIIAACRERGIPLVEGKYKPDVMLAAKTVFTTNVTGISLIFKLEGQYTELNNTVLDRLLSV